MVVPTLNTERVILRGFTESDALPLYEILSEPGVLRYFPSSDPPSLDRVSKIINRHRRHWDELGYGWWAAADRADGTLIGWCGLGFLEETEETEIKYLFKSSHWGRGIATEAAAVCVDYAFRKVNLQEIIGLTHPENIASQRVLEKIGLSFRHQAEYFGMTCFRFTLDRDQFDLDRG